MGTEIISWLVIIGSSIVKIPQIYKILTTKSVFGLSLYSFWMEQLVNVINLAYNIVKQTNFLLYGETYFLFLGNLIILYLLHSNWIKWISITWILIIFGFAIGILSSSEILNLFQWATIFISSVSRIPQILKNYSSGSTGQLSTATYGLSLLGSLMRLFTIANEYLGQKEVQGDFILLIGSFISFLLSSILMLQILNIKSKKILNINNDFEKNI